MVFSTVALYYKECSMTHALIIDGNNGDGHCWAVAIRIGNHLHKGARISWKNIRVIDPFEDERRLGWHIVDCLEKPGPLLVHYIGHASPVSIAPTEKLRITYDDIASAIKTRDDPTLIVHGGCYAFALATSFEQAGVDPEKVSLIAACGSDGYSYEQVHDEILTAWKNKMVYRPKPRLNLLVNNDGDADTFDEIDGDNITCHIGPISSEPHPEREPDQTRRWGTLELDPLFFKR